jgi:hypothetical protein
MAPDELFTEEFIGGYSFIKKWCKLHRFYIGKKLLLE